MILLFVPAFVLLLYGYALNFDIRNVRLALQDNDRSRASRELVSAFVNSGYFDLIADVSSDAEITRVLDRGEARAVLVIPARFGRDTATGRATSFQIVINGDNANTATTFMGSGEPRGHALEASSWRAPRLAVGSLRDEPASGKPELRTPSSWCPAYRLYRDAHGCRVEPISVRPRKGSDMEKCGVRSARDLRARQDCALLLHIDRSSMTRRPRAEFDLPMHGRGRCAGGHLAVLSVRGLRPADFNSRRTSRWLPTGELTSYLPR